MPRATMRLQPDGCARMTFPYSPEFVALLKHKIPKHGRAWCPEGAYWWVDDPYVNLAASLLQQFFPAADFIDAPGQRAGASDRRVPHPPPSSPDPYRTLHLLPSAPLELVEAAGRTLAKLYHPDKRPEGERALATTEMQRINVAVAQVRRLRGAA